MSDEQTKDHVISRLKATLRWCLNETEDESAPGESTRAFDAARLLLQELGGKDSLELRLTALKCEDREITCIFCMEKHCELEIPLYNYKGRHWSGVHLACVEYHEKRDLKSPQVKEAPPEHQDYPTDAERAAMAEDRADAAEKKVDELFSSSGCLRCHALVANDPNAEKCIDREDMILTRYGRLTVQPGQHVWYYKG